MIYSNPDFHQTGHVGHCQFTQECSPFITRNILGSLQFRPFLVFSLFCICSKLWNLPASQGKKQTSFKNTSCLDVKNKNLIYFIHQQKKYLTKCKIENNEKTNGEHCKTFVTTIQLNENSKKEPFYSFPLFVLQFSWFKTYPNADAKQRKTKF
jgi:hypothetical protein